MILLCNTLLPKDRVQAIRADIGKIVKPTPNIDNIIEVDVDPIIIIILTLSTDSKTVFRVFVILFMFF